MTLVIGVETKSTDGHPMVLLCGDSRISHTSGRYEEFFRPKVLRVGEWVVGAAGESRFIDAIFADLRHGERSGQYARISLPSVEGSSLTLFDVDIADRLTLEFFPQLRLCLERAGWGGKWTHDNERSDQAPDLLLGVGGFLFEVSSWVVLRCSFAAIGIARQYGRGVLDSMSRSDWRVRGPRQLGDGILPRDWTTHDLHDVIEMAAARYVDVGLPSTCVWTGMPGSQTRGVSALPFDPFGPKAGIRGDGKVWRAGAWRDPE